MRTVRSIIVGVLLLVGTREASAQSPPSKAEIQTARTLFSDAMADESAQRWRAALEKLERAAAIKTTPGILTHIAICKENVGRLVEAVRDYEKAAQMARAEKKQDVLDTVNERLTLALRSRVPSVKVTTPQREGLDVQIAIAPADGGMDTPLTTPVPRSTDGDFRLQVDPGDYVVSVRAPGMKPYRAKRHVPEGQTVSIDVELEPDLPPAPLVKPMAAPLAPPPPAHKRGFWTTPNTVAIGLMGAGVLALAGGAGFALAGSSDKDEVDRLRGQLPPSGASQCYQPSGSQAETCARLRDAMDSQNTKATLSLGFYVTGGALLAGGAAVLLFWPKPKTKERASYVVPVVDFGSRSLGLQGVF